MVSKDGTDISLTTEVVKTLAISLSNAVKMYRWRKPTSSEQFFKDIERIKTNAQLRQTHLRRKGIKKGRHYPIMP